LFKITLFEVAVDLHPVQISFSMVEMPIVLLEKHSEASSARIATRLGDEVRVAAKPSTEGATPDQHFHLDHGAYHELASDLRESTQ
jgi:hypothetical protein